MQLLKLIKQVTNDSTIEELHGENGMFKKIAQSLMNDIVIVSHGQKYRILEIEFYYYSDRHNDYKTYHRNAKAGQWLFHAYGVDLCFESSTEKNFGGGILIRSIRELSEEDVDGNLFIGPGRTCDELFGVCNAFCSDNTWYIPRIESRNKNKTVTVAEPTARYHIVEDKNKTVLDFNKINKSRYTIEDFNKLEEEFELQKDKDYFHPFHLQFNATEAEKRIRESRKSNKYFVTAEI